MRIQITFKVKNSDYSKSYAIQYHNGEDSVNNMKDLYCRSVELDCEIDEISFTDSGYFELKGQLEDGKSINLTLPKMSILSCIKDGIYVAQC